VGQRLWGKKGGKSNTKIGVGMKKIEGVRRLEMLLLEKILARKKLWKTIQTTTIRLLLESKYVGRRKAKREKELGENQVQKKVT